MGARLQLEEFPPESTCVDGKWACWGRTLGEGAGEEAVVGYRRRGCGGSVSLLWYAHGAEGVVVVRGVCAGAGR